MASQLTKSNYQASVLKKIPGLLLPLILIFPLSPLLAEDKYFHKQGARPSSDNHWTISLGLGSRLSPEYTGSADIETRPLPIIDLAYKDWFFFNFYDGLGVNLYQHKNLALKTSIGFKSGRDESDDASLNGIGDIDNTATLKIQIEYELEKFKPFFTLEKFSSGTEGMQAEVGIKKTYLLGKSRASPLLFVKLSSKYSDDEHMTGYFGINTEQSVSSGIAEFRPDAGLSSARASLRLIYPFAGKWATMTSLVYSRIIGDAANSPLVDEENQISASLFIFRRF